MPNRTFAAAAAALFLFFMPETRPAEGATPA